MSNVRAIFHATLLIGVIASTTKVMARQWTFDPAQLDNVEQGVDISVFNQGNQLPGTYLVDILLNGEQVDTREMSFYQATDTDGGGGLKTCLSRDFLAKYGVKVNNYPKLFPRDTKAEAGCAHLEAIPGASEEFLFNNQQLLLSIPQIALEPKLKGGPPLILWDDGAPVFLMNYQANATRTEFRGEKRRYSESWFSRFDPGINIGAWRLRNVSTYQKSGQQTSKWHAISTWAERGLYDWKSRLTLGERYTPSDVFSSTSFLGAMIETDEGMVPYNQREAAPVVRGIARTQARVDVKQDGNVIYSTTVAPGPFSLTDLSMASSGDLQVVVLETDGPPQIFSVPWTAPAVALHEGYLKYSLMAGEYHPDDINVQRAPIAQVTAMYGLPKGLTTYGGLQWAEHYLGASLGAGLQLGELGALSVDDTLGRGGLPGGKRIQGQTWRLRYNKILETTKTGISLSRSQYSSSGSLSMRDVLDLWRDNGMTTNRFNNWNSSKRKSRTTLGLSQPIFGLGYININASRESYRNRTGNNDEVTASLSSVTQGVSWSLNWTARKKPALGNGYSRHNRSEQEVSLWVNIPLGSYFGGNEYASYQMLSGQDRKVRHEVGLNGNGFDRQLRWSLRQQFLPNEKGSDRNNGIFNLTWNDVYGVLDAGYSYSGRYRQMNAGLSGGMIVHENGVTIGQPLGQTNALISTPGVSGVKVGYWAGVKTDYRGYTTQTGLNPYQENIVELDPSTLPVDAELLRTGIKVVPTEGAVIPVNFPTRVGGRAVVTLRLPDGNKIPFGAVATLAGDIRQGSSIVGSDGEVYLSGLPDKGEIEIHWGADKTCRADYQLSEKPGPAGVYLIQGVCH